MHNRKKINFNKFLILKKIKEVSWNIISQIQNTDKTLINIKGNDSIINIFLKISSLLCKLISIESKIEHDKTLLPKREEDISQISQAEIELLENFLSTQKKKKGKNE